MLAEMTRDAAPSSDSARNAQRALQEAHAAHESGRLDDAEAGYREALSLDAQCADAEHGLAWLLVQRGDWKGALPRFSRALQIRPWEKEFWLSQLEALMQVGQHEAVHRLLHRAMQSGLPAEAASRFEHRLQDQRTAVLAAQVRASGKTAKQAGEAPRAELLALREAFLQRRFDEARTQAAGLVREYPLSAFAWRVLGASQPASAGGEGVIEVLRIALDLDPDNVDVAMNLALALQERGRGDEAERVYLRVLAQQPDNVRALVNHALLLTARRDPKAEALLRRARALGSKDHRVALALGAYLRDKDRCAEALPLLEEALAVEPDNEAGIAALSVCYLGVGRHDEAAAMFRRLDTRGTTHLGSLGIALFVGAHLESVAPEELFAIHRRFGEVLETALPPLEQHPNPKDPERRLRVGFVSGDLYDHAIAHFLLPVWQQLDADRVELFAYSTAGKSDEVTAGFQRTVHHWFDAGSVGDEPLADRIRHDGIDVLFDLSGHTAYHRLGVFARKPAPVQISWCGYPGTTGLTRMDYFLSDTVFSPPGSLDAQFTEKLLLPRVSGAFGEAPGLPPVAPSPAAGGEAFTFGSFNRVSKLTPGTLALWSEVLGRVPQARMRIGAVGDSDREWILAALVGHGIDPARLEFLPRMAKTDYLAAHAGVDLLLDTTPYSGGTTTGHGLWMGVPTLTLAGATLPGRQSLNILGHCGLEAFIAADRADFVEKAVAWTKRVPELAELRLGMRERLRPTSIGDPRFAAEALEDAIRAAWRRWCTGLAPERLLVPERTRP